MAALKLSNRLQIAMNAVRPGGRVADVGCDHGKLSAQLVLSGRASDVIAVDVRPGPLARAQALFRACGIAGHVRTVLGDGLTGISPDDVDDVVIAGLGFETMAAIITGAPWLKNAEKHLILVPASRHDKLRTWLAREGFETVAETPVYEAGHCYTVITTRYTGRVTELTPVGAALGGITFDSDDGRKYIAQVHRAQRRIAKGNTPEEKRQVARIILDYIESELKIYDGCADAILNH